MADATDKLLEERGRTHGDFRVHSFVTQQVKRAMRETYREGWDRLSVVQKEALEMLAHKVGRAIAGNPDYEDHWDDMAGYSRLVSQDLKRSGA